MLFKLSSCTEKLPNLLNHDHKIKFKKSIEVKNKNIILKTVYGIQEWWYCKEKSKDVFQWRNCQNWTILHVFRNCNVYKIIMESCSQNLAEQAEKSVNCICKLSYECDCSLTMGKEIFDKCTLPDNYMQTFAKRNTWMLYWQKK